MLQENKRPKLFWWILSAFLLVPTIVSVVSTIHVINFFELSNHSGLALTLAIAFEVGALSALAGLVALDKINKNVVYFIFFLLTAYQMMGNTYYAYDFISRQMSSNPDLIKNWTELFGFSGDVEDLSTVKRIIAIISGAILPIVSLCFLDLSVDYIQKSTGVKLNKPIGKNSNEEKDDITNQESKVDEIPFTKEVVTNTITEEDKKEEPVSLTEKSQQKEENYSPDPITESEDDEGESDNFDEFLEDKKKRLESLKEPYLSLLLFLYFKKNGEENTVGSKLPSYTEFLEIVPPGHSTPQEIKRFLTLCNYLGIFKVSGTEKIALKSYGDAISTLTGYLSWN